MPRAAEKSSKRGLTNAPRFVSLIVPQLEPKRIASGPGFQSGNEGLIFEPESQRLSV